MTPPPDRLVSALEGRYSIERELGSGGMATVYLARDLRHERDVALKVLRPELAAVVGGERFLAEIRTTANLQHPHILPLFDSGEADSFLFYVMPYMEGESLREKLDREKQLRVEEALSLTRKVADALDYAHGMGVVHRDIKPGNVLLSTRGEPLVGDFGIALAVSQAGGGRMTETGLSLGTPHYMSPEQATGDRDVDPRSDVYALGCVLYELLAGQPPFAAPTAQGVLARILTEEPRRVTELRRAAPPHVAAALAKALEKLPADRFESAASFRAALDDPAFSYAPAHPAGAAAAGLSAAFRARGSHTPNPSGTVSRSAFAGLATFAGLAAILAVFGWSRTPPGVDDLPVTRADVNLGDLAPSSPRDEVQISPDGSTLVLVGVAGGGGPGGGLGRGRGGVPASLYVRNSDESDFRLLPGTEGATHAAFGPNGAWLVYTAPGSGTGGGALMKVPVAGGEPQPIFQSAELLPLQPSWGDDGWIVFRTQGALFRIRETGGTPEPLLEGALHNPRALPGGSGFLFNGVEGPVFFLPGGADSAHVVVEGGVDARYVEETGHLLWADLIGGLWAAPFDPSRGELSGDTSFVMAGVQIGGARNASYDVSRSGTLVFTQGAAVRSPIFGARQLVIAHLDGGPEVVELAPRRFFFPRWSPGRRRVAFLGGHLEASGGSGAPTQTSDDIWVYDVEIQNQPKPLSEEGVSSAPVWSPEGARVAFMRNLGAGAYDLMIRNVDDDLPPKRVLSRTDRFSVVDWPSDDLLLIRVGTNGVNSSILIVDLPGPQGGDSATVRGEYYAPEADVNAARVSPSGTFAAYHSNESGQDEVYIRSFPEGRGEVPVSEEGGRYPQWSSKGDTLYFWVGAGVATRLHAAAITYDPTPVVVDQWEVMAWPFQLPADLHPDGDRFIATRAAGTPDIESGEATPPRYFIVWNWFRELRERTGGGG